MINSTIERSAIRKAEVLSTVGAGVLGAGLALLLHRWFASWAIPLVFLGAMVHGWAMFWRHRMESRGAVTRARWEQVVYWLCWAGLAAVPLLPLAT
jgi:polyferredoxin